MRDLTDRKTKTCTLAINRDQMIRVALLVLASILMMLVFLEASQSLGVILLLK